MSARKPRAGSSDWKKSENWAEPRFAWQFTWQFPRSFRSRHSEAIFVWCRRFGDIAVNRISNPLSSRWTVVLLATVALALAGCGRKGPLDLPPSASPEAVAAAQANADHEPAPKPSLFDPNPQPSPTAPKGTKKSFLLDPILNSD
jgi:predicted small lipoprotein YifL